MSNMSYCRFQNTDLALRDCEEALAEIADGYMPGEDGAPDPLSDDEMRAAVRLIQRCVAIVDMVAGSLGADDVSSDIFADVIDGDTLRGFLSGGE